MFWTHSLSPVLPLVSLWRTQVGSRGMREVMVLMCSGAGVCEAVKWASAWDSAREFPGDAVVRAPCLAAESESHSVMSGSLRLQARILKWVAFPFSRGSSQPRGQIQVSYIAGGFLSDWAIREVGITKKRKSKNHSNFCPLSLSYSFAWPSGESEPGGSSLGFTSFGLCWRVRL